MLWVILFSILFVAFYLLYFAMPIVFSFEKYPDFNKGRDICTQVLVFVTKALYYIFAIYVILIAYLSFGWYALIFLILLKWLFFTSLIFSLVLLFVYHVWDILIITLLMGLPFLHLRNIKWHDKILSDSQEVDQLTTKAITGVDIVKTYLFNLFKVKVSSKSNKVFAGKIAATMVNEIFNNHSQETLEYYNQNEELIEEELIAFGDSISNEFRQFITDTLRIYWTALHAKKQEFAQDDIFNCCEKNYKRNLFNKGGDSPDIDRFFQQVTQISNNLTDFKFPP